MLKDDKNSIALKGTVVNWPMKEPFSGLPYILINIKAQLLDCNEAFFTRAKISKVDLIGLDLDLYNQNKKFVEAINKTVSRGIETFHGNVYFGNEKPEAYLETVLFMHEHKDDNEPTIICYILEFEYLALDEKVSDESDTSTVTGISSFRNVSVTVHAKDGSTLYVSPSIELLLGYSGAELKEMGSMVPVFPEDKPIILNAIEKLNGGCDCLNTRYRMVHKNGSVVPVESVSYLITDENGEGKHIVNVTWDLSSQVKIEHALERSEQKYYQLVMNMPAGISLISPNGQLLEANDKMKLIMGLPPDAAIPGRNFYDIEIMKRIGINDQLKRCITTKEIIHGDLPYKSITKGKDIFLTYSFLPILNKIGEVDNVIGYVSDVTHQKKVEIDSHERADFLNLVINAIKSPFFVKDEEHKWVMLNDAAIEMMGKPREILIGKSDYDLFPVQQADVFWKYDELVFKTGSHSNEEQINWSDGTIHTIVTHKQLYIEKASGKRFIVGTIHDISSYKKIEEELRTSEAKYHELFDNANDFILTMDIEGNITNANRTLLKYLQTNLEQFTKRNVFEYIREEHKEFALELKHKIISGHIDSTFDINAYGINGVHVVYEVKASPIVQNETVIGVQCIFSDVTELREASQKLEEYNSNLLELNKSKDKFFSIIAHDLRNPYSSLIGFSELLLEELEKLTIDEIRDYLKIIRNSAKNSLNLLENLLAWSRLETGRMPFNPGKVILFNAVEEVVNVLFSLAYRKKIIINNNIDIDIQLFADKNMLNTILNNLVMNAIKYTPIGGEINIYIAGRTFLPKVENGFYKIAIADNGIGMDADMCGKIFSGNKPVSNTGTEKEQGTGLGLILTREMIERHGGTISVESTPGKGSVFTILIPVFQAVDN